MIGSKLRGWPRIIVLAGIAVWTAILLPFHDRLPMWVEGMPAYVDQLLTSRCCDASAPRGWRR